MTRKPHEEWCRECKSVPVVVRSVRSKGLCPSCRKEKQKQYMKDYFATHPQANVRKNRRAEKVTLKTVRMKRREAITSSDIMHAPPERAEQWLRKILSGGMIYAR